MMTITAESHLCDSAAEDDWKEFKMPSRLKFVLCLAAFTVVLRVAPYLPNLLTGNDYHSHHSNPMAIFYPWNFLPLMAFCLYSGAYIKDRRWALAAPLLTSIVSDLLISAAAGELKWFSLGDRWVVYSCYVVTIFMGTGLASRTWPIRGLDALARGILGETIFFVATNFAYFLHQTDLPHTPEVLILCYVNAIPFAAKAFISTTIYSVLLFSPLAVRAAGEESTQPQLEKVISPISGDAA